MSLLLDILLYAWQLPQNLLGLLLIHCYKGCRRYTQLDGRVFYCADGMPSGISLGRYVILHRQDHGASMLHEYGHCRQSRRLGPFYLLVIGLPSLLGNIYDRLFHTESRGWDSRRSSRWYYNQPWEKWADKLGGVKR